ncbi:MAG: hydrogenase expression/formation protein HypE [Candidatus Omnitrophota bacterium]
MKTQGKILLSHGSGGRLTHQLLKELIISNFANPILNKLDDSAVFKHQRGRLAFTTDSFVVKPLFFPGGDIGKLAVCGTVNDLAVMGAKPLYLTAAFIVEEGLEIGLLEKIIQSMRKAAESAGVIIAGGDFKVVEKNACDKIFITTSGVGTIKENINISGGNAKIGDIIIINGLIGSHGAAVISAREDYKLKTSIKSDCSALNELISEILKTSRNIHVMRDPTRGGAATTLNEIASQSSVEIEIYEDKLPVKEEVKGFCEILGIDPLYMANEGKVLIFLDANDAEKVLKKMRQNPLGKNARIIGKVIGNAGHSVLLRTKIGSSRILDMLSGEQLPRIC